MCDVLKACILHHISLHGLPCTKYLSLPPYFTKYVSLCVRQQALQAIEYHPEAKFVAIHGLPALQEYKVLKNRLHMLSENLGGKVFQVYSPHGYIDMRDSSSAIRWVLLLYDGCC